MSFATLDVQVKTIVFDLDGVLVDSEALVLDVEAETLTAAGFPITADEIAERFTGVSYATMLRGLAEQFGRPVPEALNADVQAAALDRIAEALTPVTGMPELLAALEHPYCIASSSDFDRIWLSLRVTGLDRRFRPETVFSAEMVEHGKPAPDLFLCAAAGMKTTVHDCLVVEDSPPGVVAARSAGMSVVGLVAGGHARPSLSERLRTAGATQVCKAADELQTYIEDWAES